MILQGHILEPLPVAVGRGDGALRQVDRLLQPSGHRLGRRLSERRRPIRQVRRRSACQRQLLENE